MHQPPSPPETAQQPEWARSTSPLSAPPPQPSLVGEGLEKSGRVGAGQSPRSPPPPPQARQMEPCTVVRGGKGLAGEGQGVVCACDSFLLWGSGGAGAFAVPTWAACSSPRQYSPPSPWPSPAETPKEAQVRMQGPDPLFLIKTKRNKTVLISKGSGRESESGTNDPGHGSRSVNQTEGVEWGGRGNACALTWRDVAVGCALRVLRGCPWRAGCWVAGMHLSW